MSKDGTGLGCLERVIVTYCIRVWKIGTNQNMSNAEKNSLNLLSAHPTRHKYIVPHMTTLVAHVVISC